jgi:hypothetical protein
LAASKFLFARWYFLVAAISTSSSSAMAGVYRCIEPRFRNSVYCDTVYLNTESIADSETSYMFTLGVTSVNA